MTVPPITEGGKSVSVIGSRGFPYPEETAEYWLERTTLRGDRVVSGGARGIDAAFERQALAMGLSVLSFRPERLPNGRFAIRRYEDGQRADLVSHKGEPVTYPSFPEAAKSRNWMIQEEAESAVAFWDGMSSGTAHGIAASVRWRRAPMIVMPGDS